MHKATEPEPSHVPHHPLISENSSLCSISIYFPLILASVYYYLLFIYLFSIYLFIYCLLLLILTSSYCGWVTQTLERLWKFNSGGTWVAKSTGVVSGHGMGSWDWDQYQAPCSVGGLLLPLSDPPPPTSLFSFFQKNKLKKEKKILQCPPGNIVLLPINPGVWNYWSIYFVINQLKIINDPLKRIILSLVWYSPLRRYLVFPEIFWKMKVA